MQIPQVLIHSTVALVTPVQDFSDPDSASFTTRFYRIAAAPSP